MTDQASGLKSDVDNVRAVETFLEAVQDGDFDTAAGLMADDFVWQNVGYFTLRGRDRIIKLLNRGRRHARFEEKIHRIAADEDAVLTERTDALIIGPLRLQFWVCGAFRGARGPNHVGARLLRHVRHGQGGGARTGRHRVPLAAHDDLGYAPDKLGSQQWRGQTMASDPTTHR